MGLWLDSSPSESEATVPNRLFGPVDRRGDSAKAGRFEDDNAAARNIRVYLRVPVERDHGFR